MLKGTDIGYNVSLTPEEGNAIPFSKHFFLAWSETRCHLVLCDAEHKPFARISLAHQDFLRWAKQLPKMVEQMINNPPKGDPTQGGTA